MVPNEASECELSIRVQGIKETFRVLAPGGYFASLEFLFGNLFGHFSITGQFRCSFPAVGALESGKQDAYEYLGEFRAQVSPVSEYTARALRGL